MRTSSQNPRKCGTTAFINTDNLCRLKVFIWLQPWDLPNSISFQFIYYHSIILSSLPEAGQNTARQECFWKREFLFQKLKSSLSSGVKRSEYLKTTPTHLDPVWSLTPKIRLASLPLTSTTSQLPSTQSLNQRTSYWEDDWRGWEGKPRINSQKPKLNKSITCIQRPFHPRGW